MKKRYIFMILALFLVGSKPIYAMQKQVNKKIIFGKNNIIFLKGIKKFIEDIKQEKNKVSIPVEGRHFQIDSNAICTVSKDTKGLLLDYSNFPADIVDLITGYTEEYKNIQILYMTGNYSKLNYLEVGSNLYSLKENLPMVLKPQEKAVFNLNLGDEILLMRKINSFLTSPREFILLSYGQKTPDFKSWK